MEFDDLIVRLTQAIVAGDGASAASCFTDDGVYHDVFYGAFAKADIARMVSDYFHRDASAFIWDIHQPVSDGRTGYARYVFSYDSRLAGAQGRRALFEGVSICQLRDGRLASYHEVANAAPGLAMLGFEPARLCKVVERQGRELAARAEAVHHRVS